MSLSAVFKYGIWQSKPWTVEIWWE